MSEAKSTPNIEALLAALPRVRELEQMIYETPYMATAKERNERQDAFRSPSAGHLAALEAVAALQEQVRQLREALRMMTTGTHRIKLCWCRIPPQDADDHHEGRCIAARRLLATPQGKETA